jgi:outer membrane protein assembly factor BamB
MPGVGREPFATGPSPWAGGSGNLSVLASPSRPPNPRHIGRQNRRSTPATGGSRDWMITSVLVALIAMCCSAIGVVATWPTQLGWSDSSLNVVGAPITADGQVLVLNTSSNRELELTAIDAASGAVRWQRPFSPSLITAGVAFGPTAIGSTVLDLIPAGAASDPSVIVEGINVADGAEVWELTEPVQLTDAPATCVGGRYFCIATFVSSTTTALVSLNPATGSIMGSIPGPERSMAVPVPGEDSEGLLWETDNTSPTLAQVSSTGQLAWSRSVSSLFGGPQFNPSDGWDFELYHDLDVGSVGYPPRGSSFAMSGFKTVGIASTNGAVRFELSGDFYCGGGLQFLTPTVVCLYSGDLVRRGHSPIWTKVGLTLEGLDPLTGAITWRLPVLGARSLSIGTNVAFEDGSHLVVQDLSGQPVLLDVRTGTAQTAATDVTYWCEKSVTYGLTPIHGSGTDGMRAGSPVYEGCSATGVPEQAVPNSQPSSVGVTADGLFIWPTPHGLDAERSSS